MAVVPILKGLLTRVPGVYPGLVDLVRPRRTGGTISGRYCYSVWLRHLVRAAESGLPTDPRDVAELGPGDSLGIGIAALLTGAERLHALDVVPYATGGRNLAILEEIVPLLRARAPVPDEREFPDVQPRLSSWAFPSAILPGSRLDASLREERIDAIRGALTGAGAAGGIEVRYFAPWDGSGVLRESSVDMIFSQAVLEHVTDLPGTYRALRRWLRPAGFMSHAVDFRSHGLTAEWNGHWAFSPFVWRIVQGKRPYLLNRVPLSLHRLLLREAGFRVVCEETLRAEGGLPRGSLHPDFRGLPAEDLVTASAFLQAVPAV